MKAELEYDLDVERVASDLRPAFGREANRTAYNGARRTAADPSIGIGFTSAPPSFAPDPYQFVMAQQSSAWHSSPSRRGVYAA